MAKLLTTTVVSGPGLTPADARGQFADDRIDWKNCGVKVGVRLPFLAQGGVDVYTGRSDNGLIHRITHPRDLIHVSESARGRWTGNFPAGEHLIFTNDEPPPNPDPNGESVILYFDQPVRGVGMQFEAYKASPSTNAEFRAQLMLYDEAGNSSEVSRGDGVMANTRDGSAVFVGALADQSSVRILQLWVTANNNRQLDFAIGSIGIRL